MNKIISQFKRVGFDALALLTITLFMIFVPTKFLPVEAKFGLVSIAVTKFI